MNPDRAHNLQHELRTPVNHLVGYAELILEEPDLPAELQGPLSELRALAHKSLADIALISGDAGTPDSEAVASLAAIVASMEVAVGAATAAAPPETGDDIARLGTACARLRELVDGLGASAPRGTGTAAGEPAAADARAVVLVVDDDAANRDVLSRRLSRLGYDVLEAGDGAEGLRIVAESPVDVVLLDLMMPVVDGIGVLEQRQRDDAFRHVPVIMISALDEVEGIARCIELGADDYLTKPFDPIVLKARVGASVERKRLHDREKQLLEMVTRQADELATWNAELERRVAEQVREVERLSLMERFIPPQLADVLRSGGVELLTSHRREIAVLFCDLRGFTSFAESAEPEDVMSVLHDLHEAVGPLVFEHEGTLAQFTGDGMMVFFNDPIPCDDPAWKAVQLAIGMRDRTAELAGAWKGRGHTLDLGIGLAMGYATCGQIGFAGRYEYTAIGTVTNLAARLCQEAAGGQILANDRICQSAGDRVSAELVGELNLKGLARSTPTYSLAPR